MPHFESPNGDAIIGTSETVRCTAIVNSISEDGIPEYAGETEIDWDSQTTQERNGQILFICESGHEWTFKQLKRSQ